MPKGTDLPKSKGKVWLFKNLFSEFPFGEKCEAMRENQHYTEFIPRKPYDINIGLRSMRWDLFVNTWAGYVYWFYWKMWKISRIEKQRLSLEGSYEMSTENFLISVVCQFGKLSVNTIFASRCSLNALGKLINHLTDRFIYKFGILFLKLFWKKTHLWSSQVYSGSFSYLDRII